MRKTLILLLTLAPLHLSGQFVISSWATTTSLPTADGSYGGTSCGGHLYALSNLHSYVTEPGSDGQISAWRATLALPVSTFIPRHPICNGGYLLVVSSPNSYVGTLALDGSITQWTVAPGTLNGDFGGRSVTSIGTTIYSLGGGTPAGVIQTFVEMANWGSDGVLSPWQTLTPLPLPLHDAQSAVIAGYLYIFGGEGSGGDTTPSRDVRRALIAPDGTIGPWQLVGLLQTNRPHAGYLRYGGTIHIVGGGLHASYTNTVESVNESDLGITALHQGSAALPTILAVMGTAVVGRFGYVLGGNDAPFGGHLTNAVRFTEFPALSSVNDSSFQVRYASNLNLGDSVINLTNSGARGANLAAGTGATTTGAICVNVYAFSPDEQLLSCCSCPVTPNGLVALSAREDLISNSLTPAVPTSLILMLQASIPVGGSCAGSAANPGDPTPGMLAWSTTVHPPSNIGQPPVTTETPFLPATLSSGQRDRLRSLCSFINATGSGFGICRSCRLGGLGAGRI